MCASARQLKSHCANVQPVEERLKKGRARASFESPARLVVRPALANANKSNACRGRCNSELLAFGYLRIDSLKQLFEVNRLMENLGNARITGPINGIVRAVGGDE